MSTAGVVQERTKLGHTAVAGHDVAPGYRVETTTRWGLLVLLGSACLAFGAVEVWSAALLQLGTAVLLLAWAALQTQRRALRIYTSPLFPPLLLFSVVVAVQLGAALSAYQHVTMVKALGYAALVAICFLATQLLQDGTPLRRFMFVLAVFGFLLAVFAIVQDLAGNGKLYWVRQPRHAFSIFGPYVNKNHYAGLMNMLTPVAIMFALSRAYSLERRVLAGFAGVIMATSVFLSLSRGGMVAFLVQMMFLAWLLSRGGLSRRGWIALLVVVLLLGSFIVWLGSSQLLDRVASLSSPLDAEVNGARLRILQDGLHMFAERPLLGWGLGTFPEVYPQFRSFFIGSFVNEAHNDYLQMLVETGLAGFAALLWFLIALYRSGVRLAQHWGSSAANALRLGALVGCTGIVVQGVSDFNLRIPANAAMFFLLAGIACGGRRRQ